MVEDEITWSDIEKLLEEGEKEREERQEILKEKLERSRERRKRLEKIPKSKEYLSFWKRLKKAPYKPPSSVGEFSEKTEEKVEEYIGRIERKTQKELAKLRKQEIKYLRKKPGLLGVPCDDYFRVKHRKKNLQELLRALKRTWGGLEKELQVEKLEPEYKPPSLLSRMWDYIRGGSKKVKKAYLALVLFLVFYAFRNKGSVVGYTIVETATGNYLSYFLVFILVVCLLVFYLDKK